MPETHDSPELDLHLGPLRLYLHPIFVAVQHWPDARRAHGHPPLTEKASAYEDEEPWRVGAGRAFRIPFTRIGFVIGYWDFPDPTRQESALWTATDDASAMLPDIGVDQIVDWAGPDATTEDPSPGIIVEDGEEYYVVDGHKVVLRSVDPALVEFGEHGVEELAGLEGVVEGVHVPSADDVGDAPAEVRDVGVGPFE